MMEYPQSVKAGRYRITEGMNNRTLISKLRSGNQDALSLTFNNIRTKEQFAASLGRTLEADSIDFLAPLNDSILAARSEEHTSELQSLMRISSAVFCLTKHKSTPGAQ